MKGFFREIKRFFRREDVKDALAALGASFRRYFYLNLFLALVCAATFMVVQGGADPWRAFTGACLFLFSFAVIDIIFLMIDRLRKK